MPTNRETGSQTELVEGLEEFVRPLHTDSSTGTLESLEPAISEADVIGIGERSHGIRECFQAWDGLVRHLINERGIRTICCEMNMIAAADLNGYIRKGEGTAKEVLSADGVHPNWQSESALKFVEWLREFNRGRSLDDRVRICGLDYQSGRPLARAITEYLQEVDPEYFEEVADDLRYFSETRVDILGHTWHHDEVDPDEYVERWEEISSEMKGRFDVHAEEFVQESSVEEYDQIRRAIKMLDFAVDTVSLRWNLNPDDIETVYEMRAEFLADTCQWVYDRVDADRMVVLSHNIHVRQGGLPTDGEYLKSEIPSMFDRFVETAGIDTVSVGFDVRGGEFRTIDVSGEDRWANIKIPEPSERSFASILSDVTDETALVDVNSAAERCELSDWFDDEPEVFLLSSRSEPSPVTKAKDDPRAFDAIISVKDVTPFDDIN